MNNRKRSKLTASDISKRCTKIPICHYKEMVMQSSEEDLWLECLHCGHTKSVTKELFENPNN